MSSLIVSVSIKSDQGCVYASNVPLEISERVAHDIRRAIDLATKCVLETLAKDLLSAE